MHAPYVHSSTIYNTRPGNNLNVCQIASPGSRPETGCSGLVHWDDPEGWDGRQVGGGFRMGNTCTPMADSCQYMAKTTTIL